MQHKRWARAVLPLLCAAGMAVGCGGGDPGESVLPGVDALVFIKRAYVTEDGSHSVTGGNSQTIDYLRYVPGGGVYVLEPPTPSGTLRNLTENFEGVDVNGIDLSFDATQVVFSMRTAGDSHYHLYLANVDGSEVRQLTFGDWHDVKPIFVPGDRIAFVTNQPYTPMGTRADEYNHSRVVTQIATISQLSGDADRRLCAQNLSHSADPFLMSDGRIGFSRWEHLGPVNDVKLMAMNVDCSQMVGLAGTGGKPGNSLVQFNEVDQGRFIGIVTSRRGTIQAGALVALDARASAGGVGGIVLDEQNATFEILTPQVPTGMESPPSGVGRYRHPLPLDEQNYLVAWADGDVNERNELAETAPNFGIYLWNAETRQRTLVYDDPAVWDTYAIPVRPRDIPPVHPGVLRPAPDESEPAILGSVDVTVTGLAESVRGGQFTGQSLDEALDQTSRVRIIEGFSSEIGPVGQFGLTMHEGAAILGEAQVYADGSWEAAVPARLPYHLQTIDRFDMAIRNQMLWIQAMPGEERRCGGCHEDRTGQVLPRGGVATTLAQQAGPQDFVVAIPDRVELPWAGAAEATENLQAVFDRNCVSCHDGGASDPYAGRFYTVNVTTEEGEELEYQIPYLLLTDEPLNVYYEMETVQYPASYVTLLYPSAMMGDITATGDVAPEWVTPGLARTSRLVEVLNINSNTDPNEWAWPREGAPSHPEDVGGPAVSREDRVRLIQMADLGGQYWSRRNVEGADRWASETPSYD